MMMELLWLTKDEQSLWKNAEKIIVKAIILLFILEPDEKSKKISDVVQGNILKSLNTEKKLFQS